MKAIHPVFGALLAWVCASGLVVAAQSALLYEKRSSYSTIVVTEDQDGLRTLSFGRGGARQSVVKVGDPDHIELPYARAMLVSLAVVRDPARVLVVGLGGGTLPSFLRRHYPEATIDAVDIDPDVIEVAKSHFGFREDARMRAHVRDGRKFIEEVAEPYDLIFLDAFSSDSIPRQLTTRQFLEAVRRALTSRGMVVANLWSQSSNAALSPHGEHLPCGLRAALSPGRSGRGQRDPVWSAVARDVGARRTRATDGQTWCGVGGSRSIWPGWFGRASSRRGRNGLADACSWTRAKLLPDAAKGDHGAS